MEFILEYWIAILGVAVLILGYIFIVLIPELRRNDTKNIYQNLGEPRMIWQTSELDTGFWARYEKERMRYIDSGNKWAVVQTPVIPFPYNTAWEFKWFGKVYHVTTVGLSYGDYLLAGVRFYHKMRKVWDQEVYSQLGVQQLMESKKQTPVNPDTLWQNTLN